MEKELINWYIEPKKFNFDLSNFKFMAIKEVTINLITRYSNKVIAKQQVEQLYKKLVIIVIDLLSYLDNIEYSKVHLQILVSSIKLFTIK